ncbi:MAG: hypothetical protein Q9182_006138 [Xanthomendoza sp. 2 TL-2023]
MVVDPDNCIVVTKTGNQCTKTKQSKVKRTESGVFEPAILGELCWQHAAMQKDGKALIYLGVDGEKIVSSVGGLASDDDEPSLVSDTAGRLDDASSVIARMSPERHQPMDIEMASPAFEEIAHLKELELKGFKDVSRQIYKLQQQSDLMSKAHNNALASLIAKVERLELTVKNQGHAEAEATRSRTKELLKRLDS